MDSETPVISANILEPGELIGSRYTIIKLIGTGGMATVYLATDKELGDKQLAVKVLHKEFSSDKIYLERFIREVQLMNKVSSPSVVSTYDIGNDGDIFFFTMEYVEGQSLAELIDKRSFTIEELVKIITGICEGLQAIHLMEIVHRDLKPGNIMLLKDNSIKITDFGVAREKSSKLTGQTQKVGSICYMAPELWMGQEVTPAVDFYALGIVLYELATGEIPFEDMYPGEVMKMHLEKQLVPPKDINDRVPDWLNELIEKLLEKDPANRPADAMEIASFVDRQTFGAVTAARNLKVYKPAESRVKAEGLEQAGHRRGKTYMFTLSATKLLDEAQLQSADAKPRRKATISIPLPKRAAIVFEIEKPSRDFIFFGIFLISLQVFDGVLTSAGVSKFGTSAEGNVFLRGLMERFGANEALFVIKSFAIGLVVFLTILAKRISWIKDLIGVLSCIYLVAAIVPWLLILFYSNAS